MRVDAFADPGGVRHLPNDLADTLAGQAARARARSPLTAGEQRPRPPRTDMQPQQLRQIAPDRHLPAPVALAVADPHHTLSKADILDSELHQFGGASTGLQQGL